MTHLPEQHPAAAWHRLEADGLALRYLTLDSDGGDVWLVFHGYGQTPDDWQPLARTLAQLGRVVVVELPGHGSSGNLKENAAITQQSWGHWLAALCRKERLHTVSIMGYSLGGRLALASACALRGRVEQLVLCAAEGCSPSFWYQVATRTGLGRQALLGMVRKPGLVLGLIKALASVRLLNPSVARFANSQLGTRAQRRLVARSWLALRELPSSLTDVAESLRRQAVPVRIFAGAHDRVVPLSRMQPLADLVPEAEVHVLPSGHIHAPEKAVAWLVGEGR